MRRITLLTNPDLCNLHCPLCFLNQRAHATCYGEMPFDVAKAAVERYASKCDEQGRRVLQEVIPSTMGEPLLYSKFSDLLQFCRTLGIPMNITTNGSFPGVWGSEAYLKELLEACSDIKVSLLSSEGGGIDFEYWCANVRRLLECRHDLQKTGARVSTVSLQVTLHGENVSDEKSALEWAKNILLFAEDAGIHRIKWNPVVLLEGVSRTFRDRFEVKEPLLEKLRYEFRSGKLRSSKVKNEGSLFFEKGMSLCPVGGKCDACPFEDEVWVWPDGHEDHCPNPERRWGVLQKQ